MLREKRQRPLARERRSLGVVARPLIAVEAVSRALIDVKDALRIRRFDLLDVTRGDVSVLGAKVKHHRTLRLLVERLGDAAAVIGHCAGERQIARAEVGELATPAVTDHTDAPGMPD